MPLEGSIKDFGLADIIQFIRQQNKSGVLTVQHGGQWTKVFFSEGMIAAAVAPQTEGTDWIGQRLLRGDRISEEQLRQASKSAKNKQTLATALLDAGLINQQELGRLTLLQTKETLFSLFRIKEGAYRFEPGSLPAGQAGLPDNLQKIPPLDPDSILLEAVRQIDEWPFLEDAIPNQNSIFEKKHEVMDKIKVEAQAEESIDLGFDSDPKDEKPTDDRIVLTPEEMAVLQLVDGQRDVRKLIDMGEVGAFHTYRALVNLTSMGVIIKKGEAVAEAVQEPETDYVAAMPRPRRFYLPIWDAVVVLLVGVCLFSGYANIQKSFRSSKTATSYFTKESADLALKRLEESVSIYYYRTQRLPNTPEDLIKVVTTAKPILGRFGKKRVGFDQLGNGIRLKITEKAALGGKDLS